MNGLDQTLREETIRPKISRNDFDLTEIERFEVLPDGAVPLVVSGAVREPAAEAGLVLAQHDLAVLARHGRQAPEALQRRARRREVLACVEINHWNALSSKNFKPLYLGQFEVDSADLWTNRLVSSSSRSTAEELASKLSHMRTLKSG